MCGICGVVSFNRNPVVPHVAAMTASIRHRGPDGEGYVFFSDDAFIAALGNDATASLRNAPLPYAPAERIENLRGSFQIGLGNRRLKILDLHDTGHQPM